MGVSADLRKAETKACREASDQTFAPGKLETVWPFGGEAQLLGCLTIQTNCPLEWDAGIQ